MNAEQLLAHFDRISEAPDAVARLRQFVLDLAVRGRLVAQDPGDEPASELLERIEAEKLRTGKRKRSKASSENRYVADHDLPRGWVVTEWQAATLAIGDIDHKMPETVEDGVPYISPRDFVAGNMIDFAAAKQISWSDYARLSAKIKPELGDLIFPRYGTIGNSRLVKTSAEFLASYSCAVIKLMKGFVDPQYQFFFSRSSSCTEQAAAAANKTTQANVGLRSIREFMIPLPPLAEQHRIVARVDELMALCDQLEKAKTEREQRRDRLVAASLHRIGQPEATDEGGGGSAFHRDVHFHLRHFPRLVTRPEHVRQLRQTILDLAVRGRLVPQDPEDEPASELLGRIEVQRANWLGDGRLKGKPTVKTLEFETAPFQTPPSWLWAPFGEIMLSRDRERVPVSKTERASRAKVYDYYGASGVIDKIDDYLFDKPLLLIGEDGANLINRSSPIAFIARGKYWVNNHAHVLDGISENFLRYVELHINAIDLTPYVTGTAQPKMNQTRMNSIPIAVPPEDEQHRIVAKVDELMAICDQLEAGFHSTQTQSRQLLEAVLHETLESASRRRAM